MHAKTYQDTDVGAVDRVGEEELDVEAVREVCRRLRGQRHPRDEARGGLGRVPQVQLEPGLGANGAGGGRPSLAGHADARAVRLAEPKHLGPEKEREGKVTLPLLIRTDFKSSESVLKYSWALTS